MKQLLILLIVLILILSTACADNADTFYFSYDEPEISGDTISFGNPAGGTDSVMAVIPNGFTRFSYYENETIPFYFANGDYSHVFYFSYLEGNDLDTAIALYLKEEGFNDVETEGLMSKMYPLSSNGIPGKFFTGTQAAHKNEPMKNHLYAFFQCPDGFCFHLFEISEKESDFFMMLSNIMPTESSAASIAK